MKRTFDSTPEQDAAIAWRVVQLSKVTPITEDELVAQFATHALADLVAAYRDAEASRMYDAFKAATIGQQAQAKAALGL